MVILFSPAKDIPFDDIIVVPVLIILVLSIITFVSLGFNTKFELVYDGDWKQIYSNNIKADIDISLKDGTILKTYKPGEKFGDKKSGVILNLIMMALLKLIKIMSQKKRKFI